MIFQNFVKNGQNSQNGPKIAFFRKNRNFLKKFNFS